MPGVPPPPDFGRAKLEIETIPPGRTFGRIYWSTYSDPLGYGKSASRFSDPRRRVAANRFGVLYLGDSLKVCFLEAVLRDRREGLFDDLPIEEVELTQRRYAEITTTAVLRLVDLRGDNAVRMGVPTDVVRAQRQNLARWWSVTFHEHRLSLTGSFTPRASMARPISPSTIVRRESYRRSAL
ncbi:RES family NAD+ phosphorylase [Mesorhizobium sp. M0296]|uniref:RES family NAD+ phosphorylase n=1 Tax=Mesorhizobium sp. M0296 TaxID=2956931 RepID=UPI003336F25A